MKGETPTKAVLKPWRLSSAMKTPTYGKKSSNLSPFPFFYSPVSDDKEEDPPPPPAVRPERPAGMGLVSLAKNAKMRDSPVEKAVSKTKSSSQKERLRAATKAPSLPQNNSSATEVGAHSGPLKKGKGALVRVKEVLASRFMPADTEMKRKKVPAPTTAAAKKAKLLAAFGAESTDTKKKYPGISTSDNGGASGRGRGIKDYQKLLDDHDSDAEVPTAGVDKPGRALRSSKNRPKIRHNLTLPKFGSFEGTSGRMRPTEGVEKVKGAPDNEMKNDLNAENPFSDDYEMEMKTGDPSSSLASSVYASDFDFDMDLLPTTGSGSIEVSPMERNDVGFKDEDRYSPQVNVSHRNMSCDMDISIIRDDLGIFSSSPNATSTPQQRCEPLRLPNSEVHPNTFPRQKLQVFHDSDTGGKDKVERKIQLQNNEESRAARISRSEGEHLAKEEMEESAESEAAQKERGIILKDRAATSTALTSKDKNAITKNTKDSNTKDRSGRRRRTLLDFREDSDFAQRFREMDEDIMKSAAAPVSIGQMRRIVPLHSRGGKSKEDSKSGGFKGRLSQIVGKGESSKGLGRDEDDYDELGMDLPEYRIGWKK
ncbi:MAG: hypothetical protein M1829_003714 [Trizodia sp. TS-e1964]|nr:MAG: hypothetical protein M1829_003714 [Trizodia sp. TS-e1964]